MSESIRNRRATPPPAHFHRNLPGRSQLAVFLRCFLDPYHQDMGLRSRLEKKRSHSCEAAPRLDSPARLSLAALADLAGLFLALAIYSVAKNPIRGAKVPRWQVDEVLKHRRLRRKTDPGKIVWTRTSERVAVTESPNHWARVAIGLNGFDFFVYAKDSGRLACSWYNYKTEQKAMHAAVDFMRDGKQPG